MTPKAARPSIRPAHIVAVSNLKGGTGKSTLAVNLASALGSTGSRVALVDNDDQGSATAWAASGGLPVRALHLPLARTDELAGWIEVLLTLRSGHDIVVVDFPAGVAPALAVTFLMASLILIPTSANEIEIQATRQMLRHIARVRAERPDEPPKALIVPNRVMDVDRGFESFRAHLARLGEELAPPVRFSSQFDQAFTDRQWIGAYRPGSPSHLEVMALAGLVQERLDRTQPAIWPPARVAMRSAVPVRTRAAGNSTRQIGDEPRGVPRHATMAAKRPRGGSRLPLMGWAQRFLLTREL